MTDLDTLDDWYRKLRLEWEMIAACGEFVVLWDSEEFEQWYKDQPKPAREALLMMVKSMVSNTTMIIARVFDSHHGKDRICIPRFMKCLEDENVATSYCRGHEGEAHLRLAQNVWTTLESTPSYLSINNNNSQPIPMLRAFRDYRIKRQAHLLDKEPEQVSFADLWHLAREAGTIIEYLGKASGCCIVSASAVTQVWAKKHQSLFEVWKSK